MNHSLAEQLSRLRIDKQLTIRELAKLADVSHSVIAGLQSGKRIIGGHQARKIGTALGLRDSALDHFVLLAIDECSQKVLVTSKCYPAELLNLLARQLGQAGIEAESIYRFAIDGNTHHQDVTLWLTGNKTATLRTELVHI